MIIWTIYKFPWDYPTKFVARQFINEIPNRIPLTASTYKRLIAIMPPGMIRIPRDPNDDPKIIECWI